MIIQHYNTLTIDARRVPRARSTANLFRCRPSTDGRNNYDGMQTEALLVLIKSATFSVHYNTAGKKRVVSW